MVHQHPVGLQEGLVGVAPGDMLFTEKVSALVNLGGKGLGRVGGAEHGLELLIVHLHQDLGRRQYLRGLRCHQADGIAQEVGDLAHGDHGVPVLGEVAHLHLTGDVRGGIDPHHAEGKTILNVEGLSQPGPGVLAAHGAGIDHAV